MEEIRLTGHLTKKQQLFAKAKASGASNSEAAIAAGYSAKTAGPAGSRLAKHPKVMAKLNPPARKAAKKKAVPAVKPEEPAAATEQPPADAPPTVYEDPRVYLRTVMNDVLEHPRLRLDAAKALLADDMRKGDVGKKAARVEAAKKVAGRFSASAPPKLVAAGGKKV